ncbi:hypothetical protein J2728_000728 [Caulobacter segnis]|nr:hypothetical protein [Caulobacter segnis]
MPRGFLSTTTRSALVAAMMLPMVCAAAETTTQGVRPGERQTRPTADAIGATHTKPGACCRTGVDGDAAQKRLAPAPRPGPSHKAWFDDYRVRGAGLIER